MIVTGIFFTAVLLYYIYDGVKTFEAKPLKTKDAIIAGAEITVSALCFFFYSAFAGMHLGRYQNLVESYPQQSYQGTLANYFEIYPHHRFVIENGKQYVPKFISQFEPCLLDMYFLIEKVENVEEKKIEFLCEKLERGCCFGYSMALLAKMKAYPKVSSKELLESIRVENIIYYQLANSILWELRNCKETTVHLVAYFSYHKPNQTLSVTNWLNLNVEKWLEYLHKERMKNLNSVDGVKSEVDECLSDDKGVKTAASTKDQKVIDFYGHKKLFFNFCGFNSEDIYTHVMEDELKFNELIELNLSKYFTDAQQAVFKQAQKEDNMTMAGYIYICWPEEEKQKASAHAIFFQMSDGYFRFYDSASSLNHFFEFKSHDLMLTGLKSHMKTCWNSFNEAKFQVVMVGIPHQTLVIN